MNKLILNFFGEEITIDTPKTLQNLKQELASKFCFNPQDAAEILLSYFNDLKKIFIKTEQDFLDFIKRNIYKVDLDISQESQLYKNSMKKLVEETETDKKNLEILIKQTKDLENQKEEICEKTNKKIMEYEEQIKAITLKKYSYVEKANKEKAIINKEINSNIDKIEELQKKLGIPNIPEIKRPCIYKPQKKTIVKKKLLIKKIAKKDEHKKKEKKLNEKKEKAIFNFDKLSQDISKKINDIGNFISPIANEITNKITEKIGKKVDKLKANAPKKEEDKKIHTGIHCNGCGMNPIVGNRFKCSICDNFDFCEKCENLNKDKHLHPFIKIYSPQVAPIVIKCELK